MRVARAWVPSSVVVTVTVAVGACGDAAGPSWVDQIRFEPDTAHLVPGESVTFNATPVDQKGVVLDEFAPLVEWRSTSALVGVLAPSGGSATLTATQAGTTHVVARLGRGSGAAEVYVMGQRPAVIQTEPNLSTIDIPIGVFTPVLAVFRDESGAQLPNAGYRVSWRVTAESIVVIPGFGVPSGSRINLRGIAPGQTTLTLVVNDRSATFPVTVR